MTDDERIIREALQAGPTPGPWRHEAWGSRILDSGVGSSQLLIATVAVNTSRDQGRHNAEFIAACSPDRIERLLTEVERLRAFERGVIDAIPGPRYMDPPDGGDVPPLEQVRRMAAEVERLRAALAGVIAVADRKTDEFDRARAALENTDAR